MTAPLPPTVLRTQLLSSLKDPAKRAAFEELLRQHGLGTKMMLTEADLQTIGFAKAGEVALGLQELWPLVQRFYTHDLEMALVDHVKQSPTGAEDVARLFMAALAPDPEEDDGRPGLKP